MSNEREGLIRQIAERISQHCGGFTAEYSLDCAEDVLSLLTQAQEPVAKLTAEAGKWGEVFIRCEAVFKDVGLKPGESMYVYASPVASAPEPVVTLDKICRYLADAYARGAAAQREGDLPDTTEGLIAESEAWANKFVDTRLAHGLIPTPARASAPEEEREDANEYRPWESMGITELAYWKQRYIEARQEVSETEALREALAEAEHALERVEVITRGCYILPAWWRRVPQRVNKIATDALRSIARRALSQHVGGEG